MRMLGQGVMLQHSAVVAVVAGILRFLKQACARGFQAPTLSGPALTQGCWRQPGMQLQSLGMCKGSRTWC
jgi:hypothetical protein